MRERALSLLQHLGGLSIVLAPFAICIAAGAVQSSLWLDEILYWSYEKSPDLRALEMRRPGSAVAPHFMNYFYVDIQSAGHWIAGGFGLTLQDDPELYLRILSLLSFAAAAMLVYAVTFRASRLCWWSVAAALVVSASPLLLFYAFEARVSAFATLGVIAHLTTLAAALRTPDRRRYWIAGAVLSVLLGRLHLWIVCLFAGLCVTAVLRFFSARRWQELWIVASFAVPGAITAYAEAKFIALTYPPGGYGFPLYSPRPLWLLQEKTLNGMFSAGSPLPAFLNPAPYAPSIALFVFSVAMLLACLNVRRSPLILFPAGAMLGLWFTTLLGAYVGYFIAPRYQVPLFGAMFFSLSFAATRSARLWVALLAVIELMLLPMAMADIAAKGNGKEIAQSIATESPRNRTAVIVQHPLRLGYPDPLHTFVLQFYLNGLNHGAAPVRILELPLLRDVTEKEGVSFYFSGGDELLDQYAAVPEGAWRRWLAASPYERIWLIAPVPAIRMERDQSIAFVNALEASGFAEDRRRSSVFSGYPPTHAGLFVRAKP